MTHFKKQVLSAAHGVNENAKSKEPHTNTLIASVFCLCVDRNQMTRNANQDMNRSSYIIHNKCAVGKIAPNICGVYVKLK